MPEATSEEFTAAVTQAYGNATAVFSAMAVANEYRALDGSESIEADAARMKVVRFKVERWWKGGETEEVILYTSEILHPDGTGSGQGCEYYFEVGKMYLVYASDAEKKLRTNACSRTKGAEYAWKEVIELDNIKAAEQKEKG